MAATDSRAGRVLVVKCGTTTPALVETHGDYERWFLDAIDEVTEGGRERCDVIDAYLGAELPDPKGWSGVILSGSVLSVTDREPWMAPLGEWALEAARGGTPVLAICFGHQLVGEALGGRVVLNEEGLEVGTVGVEIAEEARGEALFAGLPATIAVQASHSWIVEELPPGTTLLCGNVNTAIQGFSWGENLRALQFHPELTSSAARRLIEVRGYDATASESDHGRTILGNWMRGLK